MSFAVAVATANGHFVYAFTRWRNVEEGSGRQTSLTMSKKTLVSRK